jgi:predicted amidophosphoribosyltransferase
MSVPPSQPVRLVDRCSGCGKPLDVPRPSPAWCPDCALDITDALEIPALIQARLRAEGR